MTVDDEYGSRTKKKGGGSRNYSQREYEVKLLKQFAQKKNCIPVTQVIKLKQQLIG